MGGSCRRRLPSEVVNLGHQFLSAPCLHLPCRSRTLCVIVRRPEIFVQLRNRFDRVRERISTMLFDLLGEPWGVPGEARYRVGPLQVPDDHTGSLAADAVVLFAERARLADPNFRLD